LLEYNFGGMMKTAAAAKKEGQDKGRLPRRELIVRVRVRQTGTYNLDPNFS
jgi:hypothetical protein